jgi:hypothetical protein
MTPLKAFMTVPPDLDLAGLLLQCSWERISVRSFPINAEPFFSFDFSVFFLIRSARTQKDEIGLSCTQNQVEKV